MSKIVIINLIVFYIVGRIPEFSVGLGNTMGGEQVCRVICTKDADYPVGTEWLGFFGWRTHTIVNPKKDKCVFYTPRWVGPLPPLGDLPKSLALGAVGMPGYVIELKF